VENLSVSGWQLIDTFSKFDEFQTDPPKHKITVGIEPLGDNGLTIASIFFIVTSTSSLYNQQNGREWDHLVIYDIKFLSTDIRLFVCVE
jgi:predicted methyltransferase